MLTVLKFFPTIDCILLGYKEEDLRADPDFRYALVKNLVGRRIVERGSGGGSSRCLPLSAWPIVLKRAQFQDRPRLFRRRFRFSQGESQGESGASLVATGIYYLLREGSALIGRRDLDVADGGSPEQAPKASIA
jgi:hypothetical protein